MDTRNKMGSGAKEIGEQGYIEAVANLPECTCAEEHRLHIALAETRARLVIYAPDYVGVENARCATFGRCRE